MSLIRELRRRARQIAPQVIAACLVGYFAFHAVQGERGVLAYLRLETELEKAEAVQSELSAQRIEMERRVSLLRPDSLDPDMLEERAREVLSFARDDELVILLEEE